MPFVTKILIPVDFSEDAQNAFDYGVTLARDQGASLVVHHAYAAPVITMTDGIVAPPAPDIAEGVAWMMGALERLQGQARERGVRQVEVVLRQGIAWQTTVDVARERGCDMIVMGTHGRSGVAHLLLGSVAEKVIRKAHCPVVAVKSPAAVALATAPPSSPVDEVC